MMLGVGGGGGVGGVGRGGGVREKKGRKMTSFKYLQKTVNRSSILNF